MEQREGGTLLDSCWAEMGTGEHLTQTPTLLLQLPSSSTTSRTSSTSPSQQESLKQLSEEPSPPTPPLPSTPPMPLDSHPPTPPEPFSSSRRSTKMHENPEAWAHGIVREIRDSRDAMPQRDYPRTPPTEWKAYTQRRSTYSSQLDQDCLSELPRQHHQREEEEDEDEAYWASVKTLYEKIPSCSRPRPVSKSHRPGAGNLPPHPPHPPTPTPKPILACKPESLLASLLSNVQASPALALHLPYSCSLSWEGILTLDCLQHPSAPCGA